MKREDLKIVADGSGTLYLWEGIFLLFQYLQETAAGESITAISSTNHKATIETIRLYLYFHKSPDLFRLEMGEDMLMLFSRADSADLFLLMESSDTDGGFVGSFSELLRRAYFSCIRP